MAMTRVRPQITRRVSMWTVLLAVGSLLPMGCDWAPLNGLVLRPTYTEYARPEDFRVDDYVELDLPVASGRAIHVLHARSEASTALVVILPGSDRNKSFYLQFLPMFIPFGYDVLLMDYEGFGASGGFPQLANLADSGRAALRYAAEQHPRVVGLGVSIGTSVLARLAPEFDLAGCIFESTVNLAELPAWWLAERNLALPFLTLPAVMYVTPQTPEDLLIRAHIRKVTAPKLFIHSPEDEVAPYAAGVELFNLAPPPREFWTISGGHGRMAQDDPETYGAHLRAWLAGL